jgi:hypothetical protein
MSFCRPSLLVNFNEVLVPLAPIEAYIGSESPPNPTPAPPRSPTFVKGLAAACSMVDGKIPEINRGLVTELLTSIDV